MAPTEAEDERLIGIHWNEQKKIEAQLADLVPKSISEIDDLLEFATNHVQSGCMAEGADIDMLRNIRTGLRGACRAEFDAERERDIIRADIVEANEQESFVRSIGLLD